MRPKRKLLLYFSVFIILLILYLRGLRIQLESIFCSGSYFTSALSLLSLVIGFAGRRILKYADNVAYYGAMALFFHIPPFIWFYFIEPLKLPLPLIGIAIIYAFLELCFIFIVLFLLLAFLYGVASEKPSTFADAEYSWSKGKKDEKSFIAYTKLIDSCADALSYV